MNIFWCMKSIMYLPVNIKSDSSLKVQERTRCSLCNFQMYITCLIYIQFMQINKLILFQHWWIMTCRSSVWSSINNQRDKCFHNFLNKIWSHTFLVIWTSLYNECKQKGNNLNLPHLYSIKRSHKGPWSWCSKQIE